MNTIHYYQPDTGEYVGSGLADLSQLETDIWLIPAYATPAVPPETGVREVALYCDADGRVPAHHAAGAWRVVQDWRGVPLWSPVSGEPLMINAPGVMPADVGATEQPRPSAAHVWRDGSWVHDVALAEQLLSTVKATLLAAIDDCAAAIYSRWTRFEAEYRAREAAARDFVDAGYTGEPGLYVTSFAEPAGLSPRGAADAILAQASALRVAQNSLAALRMRKYEVRRAANAETAQLLADEIVTAMEVIAQGIA